MNSQRTSDSAVLVERIRQGNTTAWRELVERYEPLLAWSARQYRLSAEDAADVVQTTWLRCLEHLSQLSDDDKFASWAVIICRRECIRLATSRRRELLVAEPQEPPRQLGRSEQEDPCIAAVRRDESDRLRHAISRLPQHQRVVVQELMEQDGESYAEASRRLGIPVGSIGPTRQRALLRLRQDPRVTGAAGEAHAGLARELATA